MRIARNWLSLLVLMVTLTGLATACSTAASPTAMSGPAVTVAPDPTATPAGPSPAAPAPDLQPYPYTTPLPPPTPTILDGVYERALPDKGTPVPCRRCAPYRADGGTWTLHLSAGAFRVSHDVTRFQGVGSFTVADNRVTFFNDPNCPQEVGVYRWRMDGRSLVLEEVADPCAFGLRSKNLTAGRWVMIEQQGQGLDPCLPPNIEAAVTGHWPAPPGCDSSEVAKN
ncbi:MAG: hypothetical protein AB1801_18230 [Chloroflexota bacterium]